MENKLRNCAVNLDKLVEEMTVDNFEERRTYFGELIVELQSLSFAQGDVSDSDILFFNATISKAKSKFHKIASQTKSKQIALMKSSKSLKTYLS